MRRLIALVICSLRLLPHLGAAETGQATITATTEHSQLSGDVKLMDTPHGLHIVVNIRNAPPGLHGFHIHEFGSCADEGAAAGSHYNPKGVAHGHLATDGFDKAHAGDFGNLPVAPDGTSTLELIMPGLTLSGRPHAVAGRAVILHANPDDFSQPTGNAGGRIGCGPILITGE